MRWGTRVSCAVLVVVATMTAATGSACACSCVELTVAEAVRNSSAVFVGTLREVRGPTLSLSSGDPSRFVFDVESAYKGDVHEVQSVVSSSDSASCGLAIAVGQRTLVFAHGESSFSLEDGEYESGLCGGTRALAVSEMPTELGPAIAVLPGSSPIGEDDSYPSMIARNWYWIVGAAVLLVGGVVTVRRRRASPQP